MVRYTNTGGLPASSCMLSSKHSRVWFSNFIWTRTWNDTTLNCNVVSRWVKLRLQGRLLTPEGCSISTLITGSHSNLAVSCSKRSTKKRQSEDMVDGWK
jgi:hypothetical protein